ncbi:solute carrier family 35 member F2 isoform X1 [Danio rerio]|uniref:Solute carrier family 35 member F2 n=3 Tax=Danio rerio TaxID=7955 RepID=A0A8M9PFN2_DANRE|nr:solute carrier family 35 member F2-like [Danio rerio]XP_021330022.1 solute carrier family 35 member F2-like [Danio rerio]|eukprot:XP_017206555.2 solute carrier family 35 member F2-like [Danio rerio]
MSPQRRRKMPREQLNTLCFKMREGLPKWRDVFTWQLLKILLMGQGLSALICGTAVTSQYLASVYYLNTPMLQSFINYTLLGITYTMALIFRRGDGNILQILKTKWWKYLLLAVADVEANYAVVKAYQYTTLTSIQLLDCFIIPVLMILSWFFLKTRYRIIHYAAVGICLAGVGAMVGADILAGQDQGSSSDVLLGDGLVLVSATLYAISNVCQEYTVKNLSRVEFLGMVGLFGSIISAIQLGILEHKEVANIQWTWEKALLLSGYALCMYGFYSFMPVVIKRSSATAVNLSLLTGDLFSLFFGLFLFHYNFSGLYIVSLVGILIGFIMFNTVPTLSRLSDPLSDEEGVDNHTADTDNNSIEGCEGEISCAHAEQRETPPACAVINSVKL